MREFLVEDFADDIIKMKNFTYDDLVISFGALINPKFF
jgi:hypothetical protein